MRRLSFIRWSPGRFDTPEEAALAYNEAATAAWGEFFCLNAVPD
jgi:hypothetical protein